SRSSLTGHLVLSTLHTNDAPSAFSRLRDIGVPSYLVSATVRLVIAQRLVRVICPRCKTPTTPSPEQIELISKTCPDAPSWTYYHGVGCIECQQTGYLGRIGIFEFLNVSDKVSELISEEQSEDKLRQAALKSGMESLAMNGFMKVKRGITTIDEVLHATQLL
ncbi:MAG: ATPase, T2SS/T4P/T4SS family, partial [Kiritimatiellaceae bacterium]|nr:ATPase, T2SS/T4P/T4SS family [Kiritimatiellaceae bacterium]